MVEDIFGMEEGELKPVLLVLSSLMEGKNDEKSDYLKKGVVRYAIPYFAHASFRDYLFNSSRSGPFYVDLQEYEVQVTYNTELCINCTIDSVLEVILMIFSLITTHNHDRMSSSTTRVLHTTNWDLFLPQFFLAIFVLLKEK